MSWTQRIENRQQACAVKTGRIVCGLIHAGAPSGRSPGWDVISGFNPEHTFLEHTADTSNLRKQAKDGAPGIRYMGRQHECSLLELKTRCSYEWGQSHECMCPKLNNITIRNRIHPPCFNKVLVPRSHDPFMPCSSEVHAVLIGNS